MESFTSDEEAALYERLDRLSVSELEAYIGSAKSSLGNRALNATWRPRIELALKGAEIAHVRAEAAAAQRAAEPPVGGRGAGAGAEGEEEREVGQGQGGSRQKRRKRPRPEAAPTRPRKTSPPARPPRRRVRGADFATLPTRRASNGIGLRRDARGGRHGSRALPRLRPLALRAAAAGDALPPRRGRGDLPPRRHHLRRLRRQGRGRQGHRAADPLRPDPARDSGARVARDGARAAPARHGAQPLHPRRLPRPGDPEGRHRAERAGARQRPVPQRDAGRRRAGRDLLAHRRHRHRPRRQRRRQRQLLRARGQPARAERRELHAREPQDDDAALPRAVQPAPGGAGRALPRPAARDPALGGAAGGQRSDRRRPHARHVQQRLLRARLPGAADGHRAGRGPGPVRQGQLRLHAHDAGAEAGRRDLPPGRRRLPRPARLPRRLHPRLRRPAFRLSRRQRHPLERHRHRRRRRQVDLPLRAEDDRVLPRREADPAERADVPLPRARTTSPTCSTTWPSWW